MGQKINERKGTGVNKQVICKIINSWLEDIDYFGITENVALSPSDAPQVLVKH